MSGKLYANGMPDERGFFKGLAQAPLHLHNAVAELIDNAIAAKPKHFNIQVDISEAQEPDNYYVTVVDDCLGMSLSLLQNDVFRTGKQPRPGSLHLREHGFGLKNVLAKVEAIGGRWELWTRDETTLRSGKCMLVEKPLQYQIPIQVLPSLKWLEHGYTGAGTTVRIKVPLSYLSTVSRGIRGAPPKTPSIIMEWLREHLGVYYRGYVEGKKPEGIINTSLNWLDPVELEPIEPDYRTQNSVSFTVNTKKGKVKVDGVHGKINDKSAETNRRHYYYRNSPESQGVDIRIGNRVVATRLISEIWPKERHPTLNAFCGEFKIPASPGAYPKTLNNKTCIDYDDEIWRDISAAVSKNVPLPQWPGARAEAELRDELFKQLTGTKLPGDNVHTLYDCFSGAGIQVDIYREVPSAKQLLIYEVKAGKADPLDVYQMRLYWDGLVIDNKQPTRAYLVAENWTTGAQTVVNFINTLKDQKGNQYVFELKKWDEFGISTK